MNNRVTVKQASEELGITAQCLRLHLQARDLPIGYAILNTKGNGYEYFIFRDLLDTYIGRK